jgi:uncharacterized SAM-binding protein YcdF (DUF218 family)
LKKGKNILAMFILFGLVVITMFSFLGQFLIVNDQPIKSDAIILLTGGGIERPQRAVSLYNAAFAPDIIVSNALEDGIYEYVIQLGVPSKDVIKETKADSTYSNALFTLAIMKEHNLKSAIIVSSDYHMRRVKFNFDSVFSNSGIRLNYSAAQTYYSSNYWFANKRNINTTIDEYTKIIGNAIGFNGIDDKQIFKRIKRLFGL